MKFTEINFLGIYVAPIALIMTAAWSLFVVFRRTTDRFNLLRHVWHPALFELSVYIIFIYCVTLLITGWRS
jgi:protein AaeX